MGECGGLVGEREREIKKERKREREKESIESIENYREACVCGAIHTRVG